jgi:hypothetical protein
VFFAAVILAYYQSIRIDAPNYEMKLKRHSTIIDNSIEYPYKYRLLNPYMANVTFSLFKLALPEKPAFLFAYSVQNIIIYFFLLLMAANFFYLWFDGLGAAVSLLMFALLIPLSLTGYDNLGDMTTAGLMALGFYFIVTGKIFYLYPLVFIGAFNELQIILLVMFYFWGAKGNIKSFKVWINSSLLIVVFIIAYAVIYLIRGGHAGGDDYVWYFTKDSVFNAAHPDFVILWIVMIVPLLFLALRGIKAKPEFLRRNLFITLPLFYIGAFFFIARMREIDKALTIFLILIPLTVYNLMPEHIKKEQAVT